MLLLSLATAEFIDPSRERPNEQDLPSHHVLSAALNQGINPGETAAAAAPLPPAR